MGFPEPSPAPSQFATARRIESICGGACRWLVIFWIEAYLDPKSRYKLLNIAKKIIGLCWLVGSRTSRVWAYVEG